MTVIAYIEAENGAREFVVGTTGWTADDLDDPQIERLWDQGRFEIVEGVLTQMPAARFDDGSAFFKFLVRLEAHFERIGDAGKLSIETDVILQSMRVPRVDAVYLDAKALKEQEELNAKSRRPRGRYGRVRVTPKLIIESVSQGHEAHDRVTKRRLYAEAGVPNYWLFDVYDRSLETLILVNGEYRTEQLAHQNDEVRPSLFPGLVIKLETVWK